jgi:hypothetical protein
LPFNPASMAACFRLFCSSIAIASCGCSATGTCPLRWEASKLGWICDNPSSGLRVKWLHEGAPLVSPSRVLLGKFPACLRQYRRRSCSLTAAELARSRGPAQVRFSINNIIGGQHVTGCRSWHLIHTKTCPPGPNGTIHSKHTVIHKVNGRCRHGRGTVREYKDGSLTFELG